MPRNPSWSRVQERNARRKIARRENTDEQLEKLKARALLW